MMLRRSIGVLVLLVAGVGAALNIHDRPQGPDREPHPAAQGRVLVVQDVLDGDTFTATDPGGDPVGRVRLVGVDAPELTEGQCWSQDATTALRQLVITGTRVELTIDPGQGERDRYGRLLGYVRTTDAAGVDVGLRLLEQGHARPWGQHPRRQAYQDAADAAADQDLGLWGACR